MSEDVNYNQWSQNTQCENVEQYAKYLDKHGSCTRKENDELIAKVRAGDTSLEHRLIMGNAGMALKAARRYTRFSHIMAFEDIVQSSMECMIELIHKFDPDKGYALSTYVYQSLVRRVGREISQRNTEIRIPLHKATFCTKVAQVCHTLEVAGVDRTIPNIIKGVLAKYEADLSPGTNRMIVNETNVREALGIILWRTDKGDDVINNQVDEASTTLYDVIPDVADDFQAMEDKIDAERLRKHLLPAQQLAIELRFMHDASLVDIAEISGTSRQNEDQRIRSALKKIRKKEDIAEPELSKASKSAQVRMARLKAEGSVPFNGMRHDASKD